MFDYLKDLSFRQLEEEYEYAYDELGHAYSDERWNDFTDAAEKLVAIGNAFKQYES